MAEITEPPAAPAEAASPAPVHPSPAPAPSPEPTVTVEAEPEAPPSDELSLEAWAREARVPVAQANHMRHLFKLTKDFKATPAHFAELHAAMLKEAI